MTPLQTNTVAVLVLFQQGTLEPKALAAVAGLVGTVLIVDNHASARSELADGCRSAGAAYLHHGNFGQLAGAYNLALQWLQEHCPATEQVLFLDEDSDASRLASFLRDPRTERTLAHSGVAAVSAAYRDRATGMRAAYLELGRWQLRYLPREFSGLREVAFLINSMSLWKLEALRALGPFDEQLGLDGIDTEMCLRARHAGMRLFVNGDHLFDHSIGQRRRFTLWGRAMQSSGHSPGRRWQMARNTVWLARREWRREPRFAWLCLQRLTYEALGVVMVESDRGAKLRALARGAWAGLKAGETT